MNLDLTQAEKLCSFGSSKESRSARMNRMRAFWAAPENHELFTIGELLAEKDEGRTIAERIVAGEDIPIETISVNGSALPLAAGFRLSLNSISSWACPACHSAHGSGIFPSRDTNTAGLERCKFYYNPRTRCIFTISNTCWRRYVEELGVRDQFIDVPASFQPPVTEPDRAGVENRNGPDSGTNEPRPDAHDGLPSLPNRESSPRPDQLAKLADAGVYIKGLERQAAHALPVLLSKLERYLQVCAHRGYRSALLISGKGSPFFTDVVRCSEWTEVEVAISAYFRDYERVVDADHTRRQIVDHFRSLGFRVEQIVDSHRAQGNWLLRLLLPRDTVRVSW